MYNKNYSNMYSTRMEHIHSVAFLSRASSLIFFCEGDGFHLELAGDNG